MAKFLFYAYLRASMLVGLLLVGGIVLSVGPAQALGKGTLARRAAVQGTVTILVLDMSGSMTGNDPLGLRCSAANAFIDLSGPDNLVGVVGLDSKGDRGGTHNFQLAQQWTPQPAEMSTANLRQQLKNLIKSRSNNCRPDNTTPTYDALNKALGMLQQATGNGALSGSVVLLTDGVPDPDTSDQVSAIRSDLVPRFKDSGWPIETIALGSDGLITGTNETFHGFLSGLSDATSGKFYDDGKGIVPGVSPLNIAPFFVDIFARHNHLRVKQDIPLTTLNRSTTARNFFVPDYTASLNVVVVKDQPATKSSLVTPGGNPISGSGGGVLELDDPYYTIFAIDKPQSGAWELHVRGSGQFLMDSLNVSNIKITPPQANQAGRSVPLTSSLALGQPFSINTGLVANGTPISDNAFHLNGTITYSGALGQFTSNFALSTQGTPGQYTGSITLPESAPAGTYEIAIQVTTVSGADPITVQSWTIRVEQFPEPFFLSGSRPMRSTNASVVRWDPVLQIVYSPPIWPFTVLSQWALQRLPAAPETNSAGQVFLQQAPYANATITASVVRDGTSTSIPATIVNDGAGHFRVQFVPPEDGDYTINFQTSGSFKDSHGDFGVTQGHMHVLSMVATFQQELIAWGCTVLYLLCLLLLYLLMRFSITPRPFGGWISNREGEVVDRGYFNRGHRGLIQWFLQRNLLYSQQAAMPRGLRLRFLHGDGIEVRPEGRAGRDWRDPGGEPLRPQARELREVRYNPESAADSDDEPLTFLILPRPEKRAPDRGEEPEERFGKHESRRNGDRRRPGPDYEEDFDGGPRRARRPTGKTRQRDSRRGATGHDYDDEW